MAKYAVYIEQTHGYLNNNPVTLCYKLDDITDISSNPNHLTQIGKFPNHVVCRQIYIRPSGLIIPVYIDKREKEKEIEDVITKLKAITNEYILDVSVKLSLKGLPYENYQIIKIHKMEVDDE